MASDGVVGLEGVRRGVGGGRTAGALRVAVIHDFLYTYAGAERVVEQLLVLYPQAELFSLFDFLPDEKRGFVGGRRATTTFIQKLPWARKKHRWYFPLMPLAIEQLDVSKYDLVISSSYLAAKGVLTRPDQLHVCYCHSPVRFAWDLQEQYLKQGGVKSVMSGVVRGLLHYLRMWDVRSSNGVDLFVANSRFVGRRIEKTYRRESVVVYPPVDVGRFRADRERQGYYLTVCRQVPYKRVDLLVEAFNRMPERKLVVVGDGPDHEKLKAMAGKNVELLGHVTDPELKSLMEHARAFVYAAEEDFGIVMVEAQAAGAPLIAFGRGGAAEIVVPGRTGTTFAEQTVESVMEAVCRFDGEAIGSDACRANAERFTIETFRERMANLVEAEWAAFSGRLGEGTGGGSLVEPAAGRAERVR